MDETYRQWLEFAKGYLKLASLCCQQWMEPRYQWSDDNPYVPAPFTEGYHKEDLLPGIFFNTKHGIELFLKLLLIGLEVPNRTDHHLENLFKVAKKLLEKTEWLPIKLNDYQDVIDEEEIKRLREVVIPETEKLIEYFFMNEFLFEKLGVEPKPDPNNIVFKYPETKDGKNFFGSELYDKVSVEDIAELRRKIMTLHRHFNDIGYLIAVDKRHKPREKI